MHELLPIGSGAVLGLIIAAGRASMSLRILLIVILGACATLAAGEFQESWAFLILDICEAAVSCAAMLYAVRTCRKYFASKR